MRYLLSRLLSVLRDAGRLLRSGEPNRALGLVRQRVFESHDTLLFAASAERGVPSGDPPGLTVKLYPPLSVPRSLAVIGRLCDAAIAEAFAAQGATAYVAVLNDEPVGIGWRFEVSRPLRRIHPNGTMLGGFFVLEDRRGLGIYGCLLRRMSLDVSISGKRAFAETAPENLASQRGLINAGFYCEGAFRFVAVCGILGPVRLHPSSQAGT